MKGEFQCWACVLVHEVTRIFISTNSLRNHERRKHEKPREGGTKPRRVVNRPSKTKQAEVATSKGRMTKTKKMDKRKQDGRLIDMVGKAKQEFEKAKKEFEKIEKMLKEMNSDTDGME
jgi:hypothetical protein